MRPVLDVRTITPAQRNQPKVPGWSHSGLVMKVEEKGWGSTPALRVAWMLGEVIRSTRQVKLLRTNPAHPWHFLHQAQRDVQHGRFREALSLLLANEGDPVLQGKGQIVDLREVAWELDRLCGRPHYLMRPYGFRGGYMIRAWMSEDLVARFERMARSRYERAVRTEKAALGRPFVPLAW